MILIYVVLTFLIFEVMAMLTVKWLRKDLQWLITSEDERPPLNREGLEKFIKHGYDTELGWIRKPNTSRTEKGKYGQTSYNIDSIGSRCNPGHEQLPPRIICFGDSFTFCRQVNDNETFEWYLSEMAGVKVLNFAVGNYGIDQAYLRMERELTSLKADIVILGVVPSTIVRILCVWKHYNEFGNTFGFKPRFDIRDGKLILIKNIIDSEKKLYEYEKYLNEIKAHDYFYITKFRNEMIRFPYLFHTLRKPHRNLGFISSLLLSKLFHGMGIRLKRLDNYPLMMVMHINKILRYRLFSNKYAVGIFEGILGKFVQLSREKGFKPVFLFMPQKDDIFFIKKRGAYYANFIDSISKKVDTIDMTPYLFKADKIDNLYSDDNQYGGHFSKEGNEFVAKAIYSELKNKGMLKAGKEHVYR